MGLSWTKKAKVPSEGQEMTGAAASAGKIEFLLRPIARASSAIVPVSVKDMPITVGGITMVSVEKMGIKILLALLSTLREELSDELQGRLGSTKDSAGGSP